MTRTDYLRIALCVANRTAYMPANPLTQARAAGAMEASLTIAGNLAESFARRDPKFPRTAFLRACGFPDAQHL